MAVVGILVLHLPGPSRQQVLQDAKTVLDPVPPFPRPDEPRPADGRLETHHGEWLLPWCPDPAERHRASCWTRGPQPCIAPPRHLLARPPGPLAGLRPVVALDLPPIGQVESVGTLPFHQEGALVGRRAMAPELGITKPAIRDAQRRGQFHAASTQGRYAPVPHDLPPGQFVAARRPSAWGGGPTEGKVHGYH